MMVNWSARGDVVDSVHDDVDVVVDDENGAKIAPTTTKRKGVPGLAPKWLT